MQNNQFRGIFMVSKQVFLAYSSVRATWLFKCSTRCPQAKMRIQNEPQINILASCPNKPYYHFKIKVKMALLCFFRCALVLAGFCWFDRCGCFCLWLRPALCALALVVGRYGVVGLDFGVFAQFLLSRNTLCDVICYPLWLYAFVCIIWDMTCVFGNSACYWLGCIYRCVHCLIVHGWL